MPKTKLKKRKGDGVGKLMAITRGRREDPRDVLARTSHQLHTETDTVKQYACQTHTLTQIQIQHRQRHKDTYTHTNKQSNAHTYNTGQRD